MTHRTALDEIDIDERSPAGLRGLVKIRHPVMDGTSLLNRDSFAPAEQWEQTGFTWGNHSIKSLEFPARGASLEHA